MSRKRAMGARTAVRRELGARGPSARALVPPPFEPGRAEPPVPITDDLEDLVAPPLHGKIHPPEDMDDITPTLDDEHRRYHHHPNDAGTTEFEVDPDVADAAADLAGDLGSAFLSGATRGEDMSDLALAADDRGDDELPLVLDENADEVVEEAPPPPRRHRVRRA